MEDELGKCSLLMQMVWLRGNHSRYLEVDDEAGIMDSHQVISKKAGISMKISMEGGYQEILLILAEMGMLHLHVILQHL